MDQLISALGKDNHALLIDCRTFWVRGMLMPDDIAVVIVNSNVKRSLGCTVNTTPAASSVKRRALLSGGKLRDVALEQFETVAHELR